ncbi:MAG: DUF72 domain-containing protein [Spirochaetaceae bacterium]|nr:MAG: DUF72 domain-containing protein [Spirochaetaceae bacterium]
MNNPRYRIGTCSWNYDSWVPLVYSRVQPRAADYLGEYARHFGTVEIDSWFYRIPDKRSVLEYAAAVPESFSFTCKVPQEITLTHHRQKKKSDPLEFNPTFLSKDRFMQFLESIEPLLPRIDAIMFEFEYLNKQKMAGPQQFMERMGGFLRQLPIGLPYAIEPRNKNYLGADWFWFLAQHKTAHVFSQKLYMPNIWEVYQQHRDIIHQHDRTVIRLMGGDRKQIEEKTGNQWDRVVEPRDQEKEKIAGMVASLVGKMFAILSINNHYEGCAPITARDLAEMIEKRVGKP